jgi:hypothetical protein
MSFTPSQMAPIVRIRELLAPTLIPGYIAQTRIAAVIAGLEPSIPGFRLEVQQKAGGALTIITVENILSLFAGSTDDRRDPRYLTAFGAPARMSERLRSLSIATTVTSSLAGLPEALILFGATEETEVEWRAVDDEGEARCALFGVSTPDHIGWRHAAGWSLTSARAKKIDGQMVHWLRAFADPESEIDLTVVEDLWEFLQRCGPHSHVGASMWATLPFEAFQFEDMPRYYQFAIWLKNAVGLVGSGSPIAYLRDAHDDETMHTLWWLSNLYRDKCNSGVTLGFMLHDVEGIPDQPCKFSVPVLLNTALVSLIVWLECSGKIAVGKEDDITGIQIERVENSTVEIVERFEQPSQGPDFVFQTGLTVAQADTGWQVVDGIDYSGGTIGMPLRWSGAVSV